MMSQHIVSLITLHYAESAYCVPLQCQGHYRGSARTDGSRGQRQAVQYDHVTYILIHSLYCRYIVLHFYVCYNYKIALQCSYEVCLFVN